jgi:hypothetical protein
MIAAFGWDELLAGRESALFLISQDRFRLAIAGLRVAGH